MPREGEFARIARLIEGLPRGTGVVLGPGDDAAVLRPQAGRDLVVTTDTFVEGRHWSAALADAEAVGRRLAIANLSDLAAMAADPRWALCSIAAPPEREPVFFERAERACAQALARDGAAIVGGNLVATDGPASFQLTLIGEVEPGSAWTRAGARPGDLLAVTGSPGRAAAYLDCAKASVPPEILEPLALNWRAPTSRIATARALAATGFVRACIDLSDGLASDLAHLASASNVGTHLMADAFPADPMLEEAALARGLSDTLAWRFSPSDDYELLLAIDPAGFNACAAAAAAHGTPLTTIGRCTTPEAGLKLDHAGKLAPLPGHGWDPFA